MNRVRHNSPSPIQYLWAFPILFFAYLLFRCYCYNHYKTQKCHFCYCYRYFHTTLLLNTFLQILSYPGVVELTTQPLILKNILWLPLCRINKFGLNTLPSKVVAIPYTCGLSLIILSLSDLTFASGREGIDNPFIALVARPLYCVGCEDFICLRRCEGLVRGLLLDWYLGS